jgi:DNA-binding NarL/FixJ family response regulator
MIRVVIADPQPIFRRGMATVFSDCRDMAVLGGAGSFSELMRLLDRESADVALAPAALPDGTVFILLERIGNGKPPRVIVLGESSDSGHALRAIKCGAAGFAPKSITPEKLVEAVRSVNRGETYISPEVAQIFARRLMDPTESPPHERLSNREFQVFQLLADGQRVSEISHSLNLSVKTVSTYRTRVMEKMGFGNISQIVRYAVSQGIVPAGV